MSSYTLSPGVRFTNSKTLLSYILTGTFNAHVRDPHTDINLEKLFRENKSSPLVKTPEKDFQETQL